MSGEPLTYSEVGATLDDALPPGYRHLDVHREVGPASAFDRLGDAVLDWGLQRGAGFQVPSVVVTEGLEATLRLGPLPVPVRVVRVVDEPDRRGFVYGTRPGHPVAGEEAFFAERHGAATRVRVRAFSRPATWWARLGGPATGVGQRLVAQRYLRAGEAALRPGERA